MEATQRISLYSYSYLKLAKTPYFSYYFLCFFLNKIREQEGRTGSTQSQRNGGGWPNNVYIHEVNVKTIR
jgi:hypothetical protein